MSRSTPFVSLNNAIKNSVMDRCGGPAGLRVRREAIVGSSFESGLLLGLFLFAGQAALVFLRELGNLLRLLGLGYRRRLHSNFLGGGFFLRHISDCSGFR